MTNTEARTLNEQLLIALRDLANNGIRTGAVTSGWTAERLRELATAGLVEFTARNGDFWKITDAGLRLLAELEKVAAAALGVYMFDATADNV